MRDELVVTGAGRESRLRDALATVADRYDLVLIDCPPSLDQLTINALVAADAVLIVTQSKQASINGQDHLCRRVDVEATFGDALYVRRCASDQPELFV